MPGVAGAVRAGLKVTLAPEATFPGRATVEVPQLTLLYGARLFKE